MRSALLAILLSCPFCVTATYAQPPEAAYHFALGRTLATEGKVAEAIEEFEKAVALDADAPYLRVEYADLLFRLRRFEEAAAQINVAQQISPEDPEVLRLYGSIHHARSAESSEALALARDAFERLRVQEPSDIMSMLTLAQVYMGEQRTDEAIEVLKEVVGYHPSNRQLTRVLVDALREAGRAEEAEATLKEILRLDDEALESRLDLARIESERGNHEAAIDILAAASPEIANHPRLKRQLAEEQLQRALSAGVTQKQRQDDLAQALEGINALLEEHPDDLQSLWTRARVFGQLGEFEKGAADLENIAEQAPGDPAVVRLLAGFLEEAGKNADAERLLEEAAAALEKDGELEDALRLRERRLGLLARRGDWEQAAELAEGLLARREDGDTPGRRLMLDLYLEALVNSKQGSRALQVLKKEEERFGTSTSRTLSRAEVLSSLKRAAKAKKTLEAVPAVDPKGEPLRRDELIRALDLWIELDDPKNATALARRWADQGSEDAEFFVGQVFSLRERWNEAIPFLEVAVEDATPEKEASTDPEVKDPEQRDRQLETMFWLAQGLERSKDYERAAVVFEAMLEIDPDNAQVLNYLGYMWADQGSHLERALTLIQRAVELDPVNGAYLDSLGWVYFRLGRFEEARTELEKAKTLVPDDPTVLEHLGDAYLALGQVESAKQAYQEVIRINDEENVNQVRRKLGELE